MSPWTPNALESFPPFVRTISPSEVGVIAAATILLQGLAGDRGLTGALAPALERPKQPPVGHPHAETSPRADRRTAPLPRQLSPPLPPHESTFAGGALAPVAAQTQSNPGP